LPQGYYFKTLTAGSTDLLRSPLKLGATDTRVRIAGVLARSSPVRVNGRLAGSAATARPATIALIDLGGSQTSAKINPDGTFSIPRVIPGTYTVSLAHKSGLEVFSGHATVSEKDVNEIEIAAPRLREVTGRVAWKGEGPAPAFTLIAASGVAGELKDLVDLGNEMFLPMLLKPAGDAQPLIAAMSIDPLPDGTFHFVLPEGEYQAVVVFGNASGDTPPGKPLGRSTFQLSSLTYGATDLLSKPMNVGRGSAELLVSMTGRPVPSFNIAGRLAGLPPGSQRDARIELVTENEQVLLQITVGADGAFEFVKVPPGKYVARIASSKLAAPAIPVRVANSDVEITLTIPPQQEIKGRMVIDDTPGAAPPRMRIELMGSKGPLGVTLEPERDGTFRIAVPEGDYAVVGILPPSDFIPAAITYGNTSLDGGSLLAVRRANPDLVVRLTAVPTVAMGASRRVSGTFSGSGSGIVLQGMAARAKHEAPIANGKFEIPDVPPGVYMILTAANGQTTHTEPAYVAVPAKGQGPIELQLSPGSGREATVEEQPTGVTAIRMISRRAPQSPFEFLVSSAAPALGKANEAAAVANLRTVNTAQVTYLSTTGGNYGGLPDMVQAGLLDTRFNGAVSGYLYFVIAESGDYVAVAAPVNPGSGQRAFFSTPDGVVRFSAAPQLAPPGLESQPVQ
jgi:hypothetical protein